MRADSSFSGGDGSENNPYILKTAADLNQLSTDSNNGNTYSGKYFKLVNDIDFNGAQFNPIKEFSGNLNGNGFVIKNMRITKNIIDRGQKYKCAIFEIMQNATVQNLGITGVNLSVTVQFNGTQNNDWDDSWIGIFCAKCVQSNIDNCFVENSFLTFESNYLRPAFFGSFFGTVENHSIVNNCYTKGCQFDVKGNFSSAHANNYFAGQCSSSIVNCFTNAKVINGKTKFEANNFHGFTFHWSGGTTQNCYYDSTVSGVTGKDGERTTAQMTGPDALTNMNLGNAFRTTQNSYPVLKAFDTNINSISFADDNTSYEFNSGEVSAALKVKLNLSNTLNKLSQGDKIFLYLDDDTTPIAQITSGNEFSIPAETLNSLSIGEHELQVKIFDWDSNALSICDQKLTLTIKEPPAPNVSEILLSPTSHSRSHPEQLTSFTVNLTGQSFSKSCNVTLKFKNKSTGDETDIDCGNFSSSNTNSQILSVTGDNLDTIRNLPVGKYTVQVIITK